MKTTHIIALATLLALSPAVHAAKRYTITAPPGGANHIIATGIIKAFFNPIPAFPPTVAIQNRILIRQNLPNADVNFFTISIADSIEPLFLSSCVPALNAALAPDPVVELDRTIRVIAVVGAEDDLAPRTADSDWAPDTLGANPPADIGCLNFIPPLLIYPDTGVQLTPANSNASEFDSPLLTVTNTNPNVNGITYFDTPVTDLNVPARNPYYDALRYSAGRGHGTSVAGLAQGKTRGILPRMGIPSKLQSMRIYKDTIHTAKVSDLIWAINTAANQHVTRRGNGSDIDGNSYGMLRNDGAVMCIASRTVDGISNNLNIAIASAWSKQLFVVAGTGNDASATEPQNFHTGNSSPDRKDASTRLLPGADLYLLFAGATQMGNTQWALSNSGVATDIFLPGANVTAPLASPNTDGTLLGAKTGTSMSAGYAAALAGVYYSIRPYASVREVKQWILDLPPIANTGLTRKAPTLDKALLPMQYLSYYDWMRYHFWAQSEGTGTNVLGTSNSDGDVLTNCMEYLTGMNPKKTDNPLKIVMHDGKTYIQTAVAFYLTCDPACHPIVEARRDVIVNSKTQPVWEPMAASRFASTVTTTFPLESNFVPYTDGLIYEAEINDTAGESKTATSYYRLTLPHPPVDHEPCCTMPASPLN